MVNRNSSLVRLRKDTIIKISKAKKKGETFNDFIVRKIPLDTELEKIFDRQNKRHRKT